MQEEKSKFDLVIIGGGPAGSSAAVYAGRKLIKTMLITPEWGGQSIVSEDIQNWIGDKHLPGMELAKRLEAHVSEYKGEALKTITAASVTSIEKLSDTEFKLNLSNNESVSTKTILITTGSKRRKLEAVGADRLEHRGVTYCASCDGLFFADKDVVVVGAGNAALESAAQLLAYCPSVTLIMRGDTPRADEITVQSVLRNPNFKIIKNSIITEVLGENKVEKIMLKNIVNNEISELNTSGIFVEIGQLPNTDFVKGLAPLDEGNKIKIDPWTQQTEIKGIWAAGDCTNIKYHQNNIAAGDGVKALEDIYQYLHKLA
jgi:alkyl hydroperoxide reductase subunit F